MNNEGPRPSPESPPDTESRLEYWTPPPPNPPMPGLSYVMAVCGAICIGAALLFAKREIWYAGGALGVIGVLALIFALYRWEVTVRPWARFEWNRVWMAIGFLGLLALVFAFAVTRMADRASERAERVQCVSNLNQVFRAAALYASTHGGSYPEKVDQVVATGDLSAQALACPATRGPTARGPTTQAVLAALESQPGCCSYVYRGAGLTERTVSPGHVIAHDKTGNHDEGINVIWGNGQSTWLDTEKARQLIADLDAGHNPPAQR